MTDQPLSPAAQAVLDALYMDELNGPQQLMARAHAAAALRALAVRINGADAIRPDILDIVTELEGQDG
jgi:hypothetical protein